MLTLTSAHRELILGGQKSGKSKHAEVLAQAWLDQNAIHQAMLIATGEAWDAEMHARIVRHRADRAERVPGMVTVEEPRYLPKAIAHYSRAHRLLVIDCMTLWLTNWTMPFRGNAAAEPPIAKLLEAIENAPGPLLLVSNEIGLGVIPLGRDVRDFVDTLGRLNQTLAAQCTRVTLMAAGCTLTLKDAS